MPTTADMSGEGCLELNCAGWQIAAVSVDHGAEGAIYKCRCGPISAGDRSSLRGAAAAKTSVRLVFRERQLLLANVKVYEASDDWLRIEGRILEDPTAKRD